MTSDFEVRKAALQLDATITAVRSKDLGSHTNHFLAGVAFALQSPHRGPRVLNALRSSDRNTVAESIRDKVLVSIAQVGNPSQVEEEECDDTNEECGCEVDADNFCSECGAEL